MRLFMYKKFGHIFVSLQKLAQALLLPLVFVQVIIVLEWLSTYVGSINLFVWKLQDYMPIIFAIGVAIGFVERKSSLVGLCAAIFYIVGISVALKNSFTAQNFYGIFCGICAVWLYNRLKDVHIPKRFLFLKQEHLMVLVTIVVSVVINFLLQPIVFYFDQFGIKMGELIKDKYAVAAMFNGFCNRLLVPIGLHHLLYGFVALQLGKYKEVQGEIVRYANGDSSAGFIMAGLYPVAIFGLPAAALAIFCGLPKEERKKNKGTFLTTILTTILTGVTEPIEYLFIFTSPILYLIHAGLAGLTCFISAQLNVRIIYSYFPGLFSYFINCAPGENTRYIFYIGAGLFVVYFMVFYFAIKLFHIPVNRYLSFSQRTTSKRNEQAQVNYIARRYIEALGGVENISELFSCTTRLRIVVNDTKLVDQAQIKDTGALGVNKMGNNYVQIIVGMGVDDIYREIESICNEAKERSET